MELLQTPIAETLFALTAAAWLASYLIRSLAATAGAYRADESGLPA